MFRNLFHKPKTKTNPAPSETKIDPNPKSESSERRYFPLPYTWKIEVDNGLVLSTELRFRPSFTRPDGSCYPMLGIKLIKEFGLAGGWHFDTETNEAYLKEYHSDSALSLLKYIRPDWVLMELQLGTINQYIDSLMESAYRVEKIQRVLRKEK